MDKELINMSRCINCLSDNLQLFSLDEASNKIIRGLIRCQICLADYPIIDGIPCFLPQSIRSQEIKVLTSYLINELREKNKLS